MKSILLVEDDRDIREALQSALEMEDYAVSTAGHGREALELLPNMAPPCLILLDLTTPVMTGWEFMDIIKKHETYSKIPVFVFSAATHRGDLSHARGVIQKPVELDDLLQVLQENCA